MRKLLPCLCLILLAAGASFAQGADYPKWDFTVGYTWNRLETPTPVTHPNLHGFTTAVAWNFRRYAAIEGDVTSTTKTVAGTRRTLFTYIVGPRFTKRFGTDKGSAQPFFHALIGGGHLKGFGASTNGWAGKFGGGLDVVAGKHVAIRVVQVDYYRYHGNTTLPLRQRLDNLALTFGVRLF